MCTVINWTGLEELLPPSAFTVSTTEITQLSPTDEQEQQGAPRRGWYLSELPEASRYSLGWNWTTLTAAVWEVNSVMVFPW